MHKRHICPVSADPGTGRKSNLFIMVKSWIFAAVVVAFVGCSVFILGGYGCMLSGFIAVVVTAYKLEQTQNQENK